MSNIIPRETTTQLEQLYLGMSSLLDTTGYGQQWELIPKLLILSLSPDPLVFMLKLAKRETGHDSTTWVHFLFFIDPVYLFDFVLQFKYQSQFPSVCKFVCNR